MNDINEETDKDLEEKAMDIESIQEESSEINSDIDRLLDDIKQLQKLNEELDNKYLMAYADAQNIAKRAHKDAENLIVSKTAALFENIIPTLDNFERALNIEIEDEQMMQFLKGFEMIYQQLNQAVKDAGIEVIESLGKEFDPNYHQSIGFVKNENVASNIVVEELQKGYKYKSKIIRPAMVKINE